MPNNNLYIVDNQSDSQTVKNYLQQWCSISKQFDIATGYLEVGGLLELDGEWQKLDKIRIVLGSEVTSRTKRVIDQAVAGLLSKLDKSIEEEKEENDFLLGVPAIVDAIKSRKIECRVIDRSKFHAKAYITHFRDEYHRRFISAMNIPEGYALVGSSNFTKAGLTQNIELNVQMSNDVEQLQDWFELRWQEAVDITEAVLESIENHCKNYSPYDVYVKSLYELFQNHEQTISEWEEQESKVYHVLSKYQKDGYNSLIKIADKYRGAFLCDGVGLGKTYQGLMLIERFVIKERKNVILIVPAATRYSVWESAINKYIPEILDGFFSFKIINHTDLLLEKNESLMDKISKQAEVVIIDEAHHFRNRASGRYRKLFEMMELGCEKKIFMLTATPINNSFLDLQHLIELFTHRQENFFAVPPLGIHSLSGHFKKMEAKLQEITNLPADIIQNTSDMNVDIVFKDDSLVNELVVQRSRTYVKKSLISSEGDNVIFPTRKPPIVVDYSLEKSCGKLINDFIDSFYRKDKETGKTVPILALAVYSPYSELYYTGNLDDIDKMKQGRQIQVVNLIRQLLLKRFESSTAAFKETCIRIFVRLRKFIVDFRLEGFEREIDRFFLRNERVIRYIDTYVEENTSYTMEELEDDLPDYIWEIEEELDVKDFRLDVMLQDTLGDLEVLCDFIKDLMDLNPEDDDKLNQLKLLLSTDECLKNKKVIIFTEFRTTAQYIYKELIKAGFSDIFELDGQSNVDRKSIIERFSPYYNDTTSSQVKDEIKILIATDVLAEGLNLQDASCLINYELHWNPVRLMQRIGRIDRRRDYEVESLLIKEHPEMEENRDSVFYWNFLPPAELEKLLSLYHTVSKKTLRISKTFGIEGRKLLTPDDDFDALKDFNSAYEGTESKDESLALEFQSIMDNIPNYKVIYDALPKKIYSGKVSAGFKGLFFCYELPNKRLDGTWTNGDGIYRWYLLNSESGEINEHIYEIWKVVETIPTENRCMTISVEEFNAARKTMNDYLKRNYMRNIQAPIGVKPRLITWMQLV